jgi:hypothetical protein
MAETITKTIKVGGYDATFQARTAGKWGCDPCLCGYRPQSGERVWSRVSYGDIKCDPCMSKR